MGDKLAESIVEIARKKKYLILYVSICALIYIFYNETCSTRSQDVTFKQLNYGSKNLIREEIAFRKWLDFPGMDSETQDVVDAIYKHQNPEDCSKVKYAIYQPGNGGLGSDLRYNSWLLFGAFHLNRVIVFPPIIRNGDDRWVWADEGYCGNETSSLSPDCYFMPFSKCQSYVTKEMATKAREIRDIWQTVTEEEEVIWISKSSWFFSKWTTIDELPHAQGKDRYWLYPKEIRYSARPLPKTVEWVHNYLKNSLYRYDAHHHEEGMQLTYPESPPEKAICMHIRHGDKHTEMKLHSLEEYLVTAKGFKEEFNVSNIFLSTDDPNVIDEMMSKNTSDHYKFTYYFTQYKRVAGNTAAPATIAGEIGRSYLALVSIANLFIGVHPSCIAFVETTNSNWCTLINDIRLTDGKRANTPMVDFEKTYYRYRSQKGL